MVKIRIVENLEEERKKSWDYVDKVLKGKVKIDEKKAKKTIIVTPDVFSKIFSPQRLRLLLKIKKNNIRNIYQLAKDLGRKYEAVYRDIKYLEGFGLIKIKDKEGKKIPYMDEPVTIPELAAS